MDDEKTYEFEGGSGSVLSKDFLNVLEQSRANAETPVEKKGD